MAIQGAINRLIGTAGAAVTIAGKLKEGQTSETKKVSGVDAAMAAKARRTAQAKIKNIQANKDISEKAKTRRVGKVMDEYTKVVTGGNK